MTVMANFRGLEVPLFDRIINYGIKSFSITSTLIDTIPVEYREWDKVDVFVSDLEYLQFFSKLTDTDEKTLIGYLNDFKKDKRFKEEFSFNLKELDASGIAAPGDLRFHSLTIYCIVRAVKPDLMIETGVAQGKSSAMALLAMYHNQKGRLISIDLPNPKGNLLPDGACTSTEGREVGWLVPDYLRENWKLYLGDARELLPGVLAEENTSPDVFFHDSLHTYEHAKFEFEIVTKYIKKGLLLCDNIELGVGVALNEYLDMTSNIAYAYRDFAGTTIG